MTLISDMMLSAEEGLDLTFDLSAGSVALGTSGRYEDYAVIPLTPWRVPTPEEVALLTSTNTPSEEGKSISLIKLPQALLRPFARWAEFEGKSQLELSSLLNGRAFDSARRSISDFVSSRLCTTTNSMPTHDLAGGVFVRPPAQYTTTTDYASGRFVGLHVDNWSDFPIEQRCQAPNRIAINLGIEDRYFLYVNASLTSMYDKVRKLVANNHHGSVIGRVFMAMFPTYPVVRVRVAPGCAYIAPTENLVHDATTVGMTTWDITLSLRGYIAPRARNEGRAE